MTQCPLLDENVFWLRSWQRDRRNNYRSSTLERREKEEEIKVTRVEKVEGKGK